MKSTLKTKQLEACRRLLKIEVPLDEVAVAYDEVWGRIQKEVAMPGFRKGNAPLDLIKKDYADYARGKVVEQLVEESYQGAMKDAGFLPVGLPKIENLKFPQGGVLSFDAIVEIRPQISLKNYRGLKIKKKDAQVKDSDVASALENMRSLGAQYKTIPARPVKDGDFILCDLEWFVEGKSIDKKSMVILPVEKKTLTDDIFNGILGCNVGEKKPISFNIDKNFHKPEYIGKSGALEILIHEIKQKELPALDDEFAKDLGSFESITHLKEKIKAHLELQIQQAARLDMEDQLIEQLLKGHAFEVPQSLVDTEFKNLSSNARQRLLQQGHSEKEAEGIMEKDKDALRERLRPHAEKQVKAFFIIEEIANKEDLNATKDELDNFIESLAARQQKEPAKLRKQLEEEGGSNGLYWQLTEAKVMDFLIKNAKAEEQTQ